MPVRQRSKALAALALTPARIHSMAREFGVRRARRVARKWWREQRLSLIRKVKVYAGERKGRGMPRHGGSRA